MTPPAARARALGPGSRARAAIAEILGNAAAAFDPGRFWPALMSTRIDAA
jgi:hypothetical protein